MTLKALNVAFLYCYADCQYVECLYAECSYGMWISANATKFRFLKLPRNPRKAMRLLLARSVSFLYLMKLI